MREAPNFPWDRRRGLQAIEESSPIRHRLRATGAARGVRVGELVVARTITPEGRLVELHAHAWEHVLSRHPEMAEQLDQVMSALSRLDYREPDVRPGRERFFRRVAGRGWVRVVIEFAGAADRVVTAFPQLSDPRPKRGAR